MDIDSILKNSTTVIRRNSLYYISHNKATFDSTLMNSKLCYISRLCDHDRVEATLLKNGGLPYFGDGNDPAPLELSSQ